MDFAEIYKKYFGLVSFVLVQLKVQEEDREELIQETFLRFIKNADNVSPEKVKAYLCTTARNLAFDSFERRKVRKTEAAGEDLARMETPMWESDSHTEVAIEEVRTVLEEYTAKTGNDSLKLFYVDGLSVAEIAARKKLEVGSITSQLSRGRKMISQLVRDRIERIG
jgi:RNA polymerase sigma factor (sigma-70 family)